MDPSKRRRVDGESTPTRGNLEVVILFLAEFAMQIPLQRKCVLVENLHVEVTSRDINSFFGTNGFETRNCVVRSSCTVVGNVAVSSAVRKNLSELGFQIP